MRRWKAIALCAAATLGLAVVGCALLDQLSGIGTAPMPRRAWHASGVLRELTYPGHVPSFEERYVWDEHGVIDRARSGRFRFGLRIEACDLSDERLQWERTTQTLGALADAVLEFRRTRGDWPTTFELVESAVFRRHLPGALTLPVDVWGRPYVLDPRGSRSIFTDPWPHWTGGDFAVYTLGRDAAFFGAGADEDMRAELDADRGAGYFVPPPPMPPR